MLAACRPQWRRIDGGDVVTGLDHALRFRREYAALYDQVCGFGAMVKEEETTKFLSLSTIGFPKVHTMMKTGIHFWTSGYL